MRCGNISGSCSSTLLSSIAVLIVVLDIICTVALKNNKPLFTKYATNIVELVEYSAYTLYIKAYAP